MFPISKPLIAESPRCGWRGAGASSCGPAVSCIPGLPGEGRGPSGEGSQWGLCGVSVKSRGGGSLGSRWGPGGGVWLRGDSVGGPRGLGGVPGVGGSSMGSPWGLREFSGGGLHGVSVRSRWGLGAPRACLCSARSPGPYRGRWAQRRCGDPAPPRRWGLSDGPFPQTAVALPGSAWGVTRAARVCAQPRVQGRQGRGRKSEPGPRPRGPASAVPFGPALGPAPIPRFRPVRARLRPRGSVRFRARPRPRPAVPLGPR